MKITIDQDMTTMSEKKFVAEQIKEFKARYTERDVLDLFNDATSEVDCVRSILYAKAVAYPSTISGSKNSYYFEMFVETWVDSYIKVRFFIDQDGNVNTDNVKRYINHEWTETDEKTYTIIRYTNANENK